MSNLLTPAIQGWLNESGLDEPMARQIIDYARDQVDEAAGNNVPPFVAVQTFLLCLTMSFERARVDTKTQHELIGSFVPLLRRVAQEQGMQSAANDDGVDVAVN
jgi:hypothetical protein